jgi:hypothetical protein
MPKYTLRYKLTPADYNQAMRAFRARKRGAAWLLWLALMAGALYLGFLVASRAGNAPWAFLCAGIPGLLAIYFLFVAPDTLLRALRRARQDEGEIVWEMDSAGAVVRSAARQTALPWRAFKELIEAEHHWLLVRADAPRLFHIIPKRAFDAPQDQEAFVSFIRERLSHGALQGVDSAKDERPAVLLEEGEIPFQGQLRRRSYVAAQYLHNRGQRLRGLLLAVLVGLVWLGQVSSAQGVPWAAHLAMAALVLVMLPPWWGPLLRAAVAWKTVPDAMRHVAGGASEAGLRTQRGAVETLLRWRLFRRLKARGGLALLYDGAGRFTLISRDFFASDQDWDRFLALARERITK